MCTKVAVVGLCGMSIDRFDVTWSRCLLSFAHYQYHHYHHHYHHNNALHRPIYREKLMFAPILDYLHHLCRRERLLLFLGIFLVWNFQMIRECQIMSGLFAPFPTSSNMIFGKQDNSLLTFLSQRKGTFQKRFRGFCPLRGGGYPPIPLRKKTFFFHTDFPLRVGGYPPIPLRKKSAKKRLFLA